MYIFSFYFKYIFLLENSVDADQTPRSAASDLGLHCLPMSKKKKKKKKKRDARLIWVNCN